MMDRHAMTRVRELQNKLRAVRSELRTAQAEASIADVPDYVFETSNGQVALSSLFGSNRDLIVIHNMGTGCAYCTLWADGYNGIYPHIADRASFVLSSPDPPAMQAAFAKARGWRFPMVSHAGTTFAADMGFTDDQGKCIPGISAFQISADGIRRVSAAPSGPHDDFCTAWHLFDLLPEGADGWQPKFRYSRSGATTG